MRRTFVRTAFAVVCAGLPLGACTADVHDNTLNVDIPNLQMSTNVDVNNVHQGQQVPVTIKADNVTMVAPNQKPPAGHEQDAVFFKIFLDDDSGTELTIATSLTVNVTIPQSTPPGSHKLLCKAFHPDGTPTDSETSLDINVTASASVSTGTPAPRDM